MDYHEKVIQSMPITKYRAFLNDLRLRVHKTAIQASAQMAGDKEAVGLSTVHIDVCL